MFKIAVLADSLALPRRPGHGDIPYESTWPILLGEYLRTEARPTLVIEQARYGRTMEDVRADWKEVTVKRGADVAVVQAGVVDCAPRVFSPRTRRWLKNAPDWLRERIVSFVHRHRRTLIRCLPDKVYVPRKRFHRAARKIARWAAQRPHPSRLIVVTILEPSAALEARSPGFSRNVAAYNRILESLPARTPNLQMLDINALFRTSDLSLQELILPDDMHLTRAGHALMADALAASIRQAFPPHLKPESIRADEKDVPARPRSLEKVVG